jgi:hypothetical protein
VRGHDWALELVTQALVTGNMHGSVNREIFTINAQLDRSTIERSHSRHVGVVQELMNQTAECRR